MKIDVFESVPDASLTHIAFINFGNIYSVYELMIWEDPSFVTYFPSVCMLDCTALMNLVIAVIAEISGENVPSWESQAGAERSYDDY